MSSTEQRVAFRSTAVVTGFEGKVECVTHYSSRVVVGSKDGRLVMYDTRKGTSTSTASYAFPHGKRVEQLLAVPHIRMLIVVSNGEISAHGATDLKPLDFDFSKVNMHQVRMVCVNQRGPPHFRLGVALLKRKAIAIYQYQSSDKTYGFLREFSTQDVPEAMAWYRNKVVVGFRKDYFLLNDKTGDATQINSPGIQDPTVFPVVKLLPKEEILVAVMDRVGVFVGFTGDAVPKNSVTWSQSPQHVEFSTPYLLALVPRVGVEIHRASDGALVQTLPLTRAVCMFGNGMKWDMEPRQSGDSEDVVIVGVRDSGGTSSVLKIEQMPLDQQVGELLDRGQIDEAQNLVRKSIASLSSDKQRSKIKRFQRQATVALLRRLEFDQAADYMYRAAIEPCEFIAFFPELQCSSFAYEPSVFKAEVLPRGNSSSPDISSVIKEILSSPRAPLSSDISQSDAADLVVSAQKALLKFLGQYKKHMRDKARARTMSSARGRSVSSAASSPKDARRIEAIDTALFRLYVHFKRYKEVLVLIQEPNPDVEGPPGSAGGCALDLESCRSLLMKHKLYYEAGQLLVVHRNYDEALEVFALLHHGEYKQRGGSSGMPKSPIEAAIDVLLIVPETESEFIFKQSIWIIKATSPKQALRIFTDRRPPLPSNDVVAHLRQHSDDPAIVQRYLETLVKATGEAGAALAAGTTGATGAAEGGSGGGVEIEGSSRGFAGLAADPLGVNDSYSHFLAGDNDDDDEPTTRGPDGGAASIVVDPHHTRLAIEYLDETLRLVARGDVPSKSQPGKEPGALGDARKRLLKFLKAGTSRYDVAPLVEKIKGKPLYNEFVILCGRGALHEEAVNSLVYELNDLRGAESYSVKYGARAPSVGSSAPTNKKAGAGAVVMERNDALMELLKICFSPRDESKKAAFNDFGFQLLARHGKSLDSTTVLELVPPTTPLAKLGEFFAQALPHSAHNVREMSITKSLSNVYNLQVQCDRVERLSQSVQVDPNTLCPVCHKRIGDIVFAVYPNNKVVHYNCTNSNLTLCPVTGERFS
ncbi:transforming growth factor, beta receptor associated protein 1 [Phytophthora boehmeriae]|uniref:Transforming growth factor, beta receptor associated protein 1 n=1 Tax=Phytophthora boehmeriae TaxID=109152 RepID=A0A8T1X106_9STRA|nr:transforming growth factor, beta receptor associated protein 1 [Phytophthora boehmeriae]